MSSQSGVASPAEPGTSRGVWLDHTAIEYRPRETLASFASTRLDDDFWPSGETAGSSSTRPLGEATDHRSLPVSATRYVIDEVPPTSSTATTWRPVGEKAGRLREPCQAVKAGPKVSCSYTAVSPAKKTSGHPVPSGVLIVHHPDSGVRQEKVDPPTVALTYQAADPMGSCPASR